MSEYDWKNEFNLKAWGGCTVARLIDSEEVIAGLEKVWNALNCMEHELYADYVYDALALLKAKPVRRGRWIMGDTAEAFDIQGVKTWAVKAKCSECGLVCKFIEAHGIYDFCPRCGAKAVCDYDAPTIEEDEDDSDNADP